MSPLRSILRNFLIQNGYYLSRSSNIEDVRALINSLRVAGIEQDLIRIGGPGDGGYWVPDDLSDVVACFSPGAGGRYRHCEASTMLRCLSMNGPGQMTGRSILDLCDMAFDRDLLSGYSSALESTIA